MIIVGIVVLFMCGTLGGLYKFNKEVLYVYEGEETQTTRVRTNIQMAPAVSPQISRPVKQAGPLPSFAFRTQSEPELSQQFKVVEERRQGLNEIAALGTPTANPAPGGSKHD